MAFAAPDRMVNENSIYRLSVVHQRKHAMRETGPANITPSGVPATRRAYRAALARLEATLAGRALTDATLAEHVTALTADGLTPASIAQALAAACFLARVASWPNPRGSMAGDALRIARRHRAGQRHHRGCGIQRPPCRRGNLLMTLLGREVPDCDATLMFTDHELAFLQDYADKFSQTPPRGLSTAVRLVALLGGYRNHARPCPDPGHQIMWRGYERLSAATLEHRIAKEIGSRVAVVTEEK